MFEEFYLSHKTFGQKTIIRLVMKKSNQKRQIDTYFYYICVNF